MARKSVADRLQEQFESRPPTRHRPMAPVTSLRRRPRSALFGLVVAGIAFAMMGYVMTSLVVDGMWWNVQSQAVCTITATAHHAVYGKSGFLGTDWDISTADCGTLQVTRNGERFPDSQAQRVARSLHVASTYRLYLRGWDGWPGGSRAIIAATQPGTAER